MSQCEKGAPEGPPSGGASERLLPLVYEELRRLAHCRLAKEPPGPTLDTTGLVHDAYLRLVEGGTVVWANRAHFFAAAAVSMRRILVERARRQHASKHGGGQTRVTLDDGTAATPARTVDLLALDEALRRLEAHDGPMCEVVMLRFFAGLSVEETATTLGLSPRTVKRKWTFAKAWLHDAVASDARPAP